MKKFIIMVVSVTVLSVMLFSHINAQTKFIMKDVQIFSYGDRSVIVWDQNMQQTLRLLYPNVSSANRCSVFYYQGTDFCAHYFRIYQTGLNVAYQDEGERGTKQMMFFQDESGKYWGPYSVNKAQLPLINK